MEKRIFKFVLTLRQRLYLLFVDYRKTATDFLKRKPIRKSILILRRIGRSLYLAGGHLATQIKKVWLLFFRWIPFGVAWPIMAFFLLGRNFKIALSRMKDYDKGEEYHEEYSWELCPVIARDVTRFTALAWFLGVPIAHLVSRYGDQVLHTYVQEHGVLCVLTHWVLTFLLFAAAEKHADRYDISD